MITLIILFRSWVNENNTVIAFRQHRVNEGNFSRTSPSFLFLSGESVPSGIVGGTEMGGVWRGIKAACPAVDQGRNPAGGCLSLEQHGQRQEILTGRGETIISGWRLVQYVDFLWLHMSNVMINVLRGKKKKERETFVLGFRCGDISPV